MADTQPDVRTVVSIQTQPMNGRPTVWSVEVGETAQKHVLRTFNPSGDARVDATKVLCAALIQQMIDLRDASSLPHVKRACSIAITQCEALQMQAVKANFVQA